MKRAQRAVFLALIIAGIALCARAEDIEDEENPVPAKKTCRTALELIAEQNPSLPLHPVFQNIFASPDLKGTLFVPTGAAWDEFFTTLRQRRGNPDSQQLVARYGQILLYHLAQDENYKGVKVPVAEPTPGVPQFLVSTASTLQCSVGVGMPNNRLLVTKLPDGVMVQHGTGNATIVSKPIRYCGGEAFLVDQVMIPCMDVSAIMSEAAAILNPCTGNLETALMKSQLTSFHALMLATGLSMKAYTSVQPFTMFVPTDAAFEAAVQNGDLDYGTMFAKDRAGLIGMLAYHLIPMHQYTSPSRVTAAMDTLLQELGNVTCGKPRLSWRSDRYVYGGTGSAAVATSSTGCNTVFYPVEAVLQPCCRKLSDLLNGRRGLATMTKKGSMEARSYDFLKKKAAPLKNGRIYFVMPSEVAWKQLKKDAAAAKFDLTEARVNAIMEYLYTRSIISPSTVQLSDPVPTGLSGKEEALQQVCGKMKADGMLRMTSPDASNEDAAADDAAAPAPAAVEAAGPAPASAVGGMATGVPMATAAAAAPVGAATANALMAGRRRLQAGSGLLLPTSFTGGSPIAAATGPTDAGQVLTGKLMVMDGAAPTAASAIPVKRQTFACDATIFHVDTVPLPCAFIKRTVLALPSPAPVPAPAPEQPLTLDNSTNTTAPSNSTRSKSAAAAAGPIGAALTAPLLLAALLL